MKLRAYKETDAEEILKWVKDEREFRLWSADRYGEYPISAQDMNKNYSECQKKSNFYPFIVEEDGKMVGHFILRNPGEDVTVIKIGFVILDGTVRGKGYGKKLIEEAIAYAKKNLGAKKITLGVFTHNYGAIHCYKSVGFKLVSIEKNAYKYHNENWDFAEMVLDR